MNEDSLKNTQTDYNRVNYEKRYTKEKADSIAGVFPWNKVRNFNESSNDILSTRKE